MDGPPCSVDARVAVSVAVAFVKEEEGRLDGGRSTELFVCAVVVVILVAVEARVAGGVLREEW